MNGLSKSLHTTQKLKDIQFSRLQILLPATLSNTENMPHSHVVSNVKVYKSDVDDPRRKEVFCSRRSYSEHSTLEPSDKLLIRPAQLVVTAPLVLQWTRNSPYANHIALVSTSAPRRGATPFCVRIKKHRSHKKLCGSLYNKMRILHKVLRILPD